VLMDMAKINGKNVNPLTLAPQFHFHRRKGTQPHQPGGQTNIRMGPIPLRKFKKNDYLQHYSTLFNPRLNL
jgi:hypothetical protein